MTDVHDRADLVTVGQQPLRVAVRPGTGGGPLRMSTPQRHRDPAHARRIAGDIYGGALRHQPELAERLVNAKVMAVLLPAATLYVFPDGHLSLLTRAEELAPVVRDFLT